MGERMDCEKEGLSRTEGGADKRGVIEKSPFKKNRNKSTIDTIPHGLLSKSTHTNDVVFCKANVKNKCDRDSSAFITKSELKGWNYTQIQQKGVTLEINVLIG